MTTRGRPVVGVVVPAAGPLSRIRPAPAVIAKADIARSPAGEAFLAARAMMADKDAERRRLLDSLREALDGWSARAGEDDVGRIESLRKRWGLSSRDD